MRLVIFEFVASAMNVYDPKGADFVLFVLIVPSLSLPVFYLSYMSGYLRCQEELLDKMNKVIEAINEVKPRRYRQ